MDETRRDFLRRRISLVEGRIIDDMSYLNDVDSHRHRRIQSIYEFYSDFSKELWDRNPQNLNYLMTKFHENIYSLTQCRYDTGAFSCLFGTAGNASITLDQVKGFVHHCACLIPDILADFSFESSSQVALAINVKNFSDFMYHMSSFVRRQDDKVYLESYNLTEADILPQVLAGTMAPPVALVNVCDGVDYRFVDVARVIENGDYNLMRMFVKYGVIDRPTTIPYFFAVLLENYTVSLADCREFLQNQDQNQVAELDRIGEDAGSRKSFIQMLRFHKRSSETKVLNRLQAISYVLPILSRREYLNADYTYESGNRQIFQNVACMKLFFEASAQPYVTPHEIVELLEQSCQVGRKISRFPACRERNEECIREEYRRVFPESGVKQPRSLKDLSRRAMRGALCQMGQLPEVLDRLEWNQLLKKYASIV